MKKIKKLTSNRLDEGKQDLTIDNGRKGEGKRVGFVSVFIAILLEKIKWQLKEQKPPSAEPTEKLVK